MSNLSDNRNFQFCSLDTCATRDVELQENDQEAATAGTSSSLVFLTAHEEQVESHRCFSFVLIVCSCPSVFSDL